MKHFCSILLAGLLAFSCGRSHSNLLKVNVDKALKYGVCARDLYAQADEIPLHYPGEMVLRPQENVVMDVAADRFFLLDRESNAILAFDWNGAYVTSIGSVETIIDFSVYRGEILDVLTESAITEYAAKDGALLESYPIQNNGMTLKCLARVDEDSFAMLGCQGGRAYDCGYIIGKTGFYSVALHAASDYLVTRSFVPDSEVRNSRFFRYDGSVFRFLSESGEIDGYTGDDFIWPAYVWDFGKVELCFTNAQKTADRLYLAFVLNGHDYVLVYNLTDKKNKVVRHSDFPLGVIRDGYNYSCQPSGTGERLMVIRHSL